MYKVYTSTHSREVEDDEEEEVVGFPTLVTEGVATRTPANAITMFNFLSFKLLQVHQKRKEIVKTHKQLETGN